MNRAYYPADPGDSVNAQHSRRWPWVPSSLVGLPLDVVRRVVAGDLYALRQMFAAVPGVKL